jgi:hypothetical protein
MAFPTPTNHHFFSHEFSISLIALLLALTKEKYATRAWWWEAASQLNSYPPATANGIYFSISLKKQAVKAHRVLVFVRG